MELGITSGTFYFALVASVAGGAVHYTLSSMLA